MTFDDAEVGRLRNGQPIPEGSGAKPMARMSREEFVRSLQPCTPRCDPGPVHSLDCPKYQGPLSRTGSLESAPHWSDTTGQTW
jgi:hypothetical protein